MNYFVLFSQSIIFQKKKYEGALIVSGQVKKQKSVYSKFINIESSSLHEITIQYNSIKWEQTFNYFYDKKTN